MVVSWTLVLYAHRHGVITYVPWHLWLAARVDASMKRNCLIPDYLGDLILSPCLCSIWWIKGGNEPKTIGLWLAQLIHHSAFHHTSLLDSTIVIDLCPWYNFSMIFEFSLLSILYRSRISVNELIEHNFWCHACYRFNHKTLATDLLT